MNKLEIRGELIKAGSSFAAVGREVGVTGTAVQYTANRHSPSRRIAQALADKINQPLTKVFPEYKESV